MENAPVSKNGFQRVAWFCVLLGFGGCAPAQVERQIGAALSAEKAGLQVQWMQRPLLKGESSADYPYGRKVQEEGKVDFQILSIQNRAETKLGLHFGEVPDRSIGIRFHHYCQMSPGEARRYSHAKVFERVDGRARAKHELICVYESRWRWSEPRILRENGRFDPVSFRPLSATESVVDAVDLLPGEKVVLVLALRPYEGAPIKSDTPPDYGSPAGLRRFLPPGVPVFYRTGNGPVVVLGHLDYSGSSQVMADQMYAGVEYENALVPSLFLVGADRFSLTPLSLGNLPGRRFDGSPGYRRLFQAGRANPAQRNFTISGKGIPIPRG